MGPGTWPRSFLELSKAIGIDLFSNSGFDLGTVSALVSGGPLGYASKCGISTWSLTRKSTAQVAGRWNRRMGL